MNRIFPAKLRHLAPVMCFLGLIFPIAHITGAVLKLTAYEEIPQVNYQPVENNFLNDAFIKQGVSKAIIDIKINVKESADKCEGVSIKSKVWFNKILKDSGYNTCLTLGDDLDSLVVTKK